MNQLESRIDTCLESVGEGSNCCSCNGDNNNGVDIDLERALFAVKEVIGEPFPAAFTPFRLSKASNMAVEF